MYRVWNFLTNYSLLLIIGALIALIWANIDYESYHYFVEFVIWDNVPIGHPHDGHRTLTLHYLVNDVLMAFFFAIAAKEVWEAVILKNGRLRGRKAATPLFATLGGMLGPITVYLGLALFLGSDTYNAVANGWAIPTATDIAFSYLVGRIVFGAGPPGGAVPAAAGDCRRRGRPDHSGDFLPLGRSGARCGCWCRWRRRSAYSCCSTGCRARWTGATRRARSRPGCAASCPSCPICWPVCISWYGFHALGPAPGAGAVADRADDPARRPRLWHLLARPSNT